MPATPRSAAQGWGSALLFLRFALAFVLFARTGGELLLQRERVELRHGVCLFCLPPLTPFREKPHDSDLAVE